MPCHVFIFSPHGEKRSPLRHPLRPSLIDPPGRLLSEHALHTRQLPALVLGHDGLDERVIGTGGGIPSWAVGGGFDEVGNVGDWSSICKEGSEGKRGEGEEEDASDEQTRGSVFDH